MSPHVPIPPRMPSEASAKAYLRTPLGIMLLGFLALGVCLLVMCLVLGLHAGHLALLFPFVLLVLFPVAALVVYIEQSRRGHRSWGGH